MAEEKNPAIVIDNGSGAIKAGVALGDDIPQVVFPTVVGRPSLSELNTETKSEIYVGNETQNERNLLNLTYPIERGIIRDWDAMEAIWKHTINNELKVESKEYPVLLADSPPTTKDQREKITEIMFESFNIPLLYIAIQEVLSLYASGRITGVVLDSGEGVTNIIAVYEGYTLPHAISRLDLAGRDLTGYLETLLTNNGHSFPMKDKKDIVCDIKEKLCYIALDFEEEIQNSNNSSKKSYELPDGQVINLDANVCFKCPEILFNPSLIDMESHSIHKLVYDSVMKCDIDMRKDFFGNIVLNGGSTLFPGFAQRLEKEIAHVNGTLSLPVKVIAPSERKYAVWNGGCLIGAAPSYRDWIRKEEYDESGASIVHRKCF